MPDRFSLCAAAMVLPFLPIAAAAPAQSVPPSDGEVVVTGRGLDQRPGDRAFDIVTIDRDRIDGEASGRLEGVLADVAGLQQFRRSDSRSANPTSQGITLRGIGGNAASRALLILDGVPQADPFGGWVAFPAYATGRLGLIRVTRGGGSGYFGSGALAGTVELESATPAQLAPVEGALAIGSRAAVDAQGAATLLRDAGFATLSAAYARGDGFTPTAPADRGSIDRPAPYRSASGAIRAVIGVGGNSEFQANLSAFSDRRERGTPFTANRSDGADASLRLVGRGRWSWSALAYLQVRSFASSFAAIDAPRTTATQTLDQYNTPATGTGARVEVSPPLGHVTDLRIGADVRMVDGLTQERYSYVGGLPTRRREAGGSNRTAGLFLDASQRAGPVTLTLGGRIDRWWIMDGRLREAPLVGGAALTDLHFADRHGTQTTGRAGVAWQPAPALTLRAAGYRGWRLPTLNELYRPFRVGADAAAANAALAPERLVGVDAGMEWRPARAFVLAATYYRNRLDGAIANVAAAQGPGNFPGVGFVGAGGIYRVRQNLDAIRASGVEIDAGWTGPRWFARASSSHGNSRVSASGAAVGLNGLRPAQTPRDQLSTTLGWRRGALGASATVRHTARQFEDDQNSRTLAAATTVDLTASVPIGHALSVELRAENALDARVEAGISGAGVVERATPRTLWLGLRYRPR